MTKILSSTRYKVLTNDDPEVCSDGNTAAYTYCWGDTIYICLNAVDSGNTAFAETLVHESAHDAGDCDECAAERTTQAAFQAAGSDYQFRYTECN